MSPARTPRWRRRPRGPYCNRDDCGLRWATPHRHMDVEPAPAGLEYGQAGMEVHRPHPGANAWPDDAVTVTYAELRRLVALHLDLCSQTMPGVQPWQWIKERRRAVLDGEAPLLLSEVLDPPSLVAPATDPPG